MNIRFIIYQKDVHPKIPYDIYEVELKFNKDNRLNKEGSYYLGLLAHYKEQDYPVEMEFVEI